MKKTSTDSVPSRVFADLLNYVSKNRTSVYQATGYPLRLAYANRYGRFCHIDFLEFDISISDVEFTDARDPGELCQGKGSLFVPAHGM